MFFLLLESICISGKLSEDTDILIYTSTAFMNIIKQSHLFIKNIKFVVNDTYNSIDSACKARLDLFFFKSVSKYSKFLYLDTDIIVKDDINKIFQLDIAEKLYVVEEGTIDDPQDFWGKTLFGDDVNKYEDKSAFSSGIMLFRNCENMRFLFEKINEDILIHPDLFHDQPCIIYNAFKYNMFNNKLLIDFVVNNDSNINSNKIIHHFPGHPGIYQHKIINMSNFTNNLKESIITSLINKTKDYINTNLLPIIINSGELLEGNIFMLHHTTTYTETFIKKAKNISNFVLNKNKENIMEIGFNAGFSALLMLFTNPYIKLTCFDLGEHTYTIPCFQKIKETFGDRINIIIGDSTQTLARRNDIYDLIHIDGGHATDVATSDIENAYRFSKTGTVLIMDDYNFPNLHSLWDCYIDKYKLKPLHISIYDSPHHDVKYVIL
jgi:lipopolysaccharide biosynthesis glycosyltransferase